MAIFLESIWYLTGLSVAELLHLMGTTSYGYWLVPSVGAFIGWYRTKERWSLKAVFNASKDGFAAVLCVFVALLSYEFFWNVPHQIQNKYATLSAPPLVHKAPTLPSGYKEDKEQRKTPLVSIQPTPYCQVASGAREPRVREGDDPFCEFDDAHLIARGDALVSKMTALVDTYKRELANTQHTGGPHPERVGPNSRFRMNFEECCASQIGPLRKELVRRMPGGADVGDHTNYMYAKLKPALWEDIDTHAWDVQDCSDDLNKLIAQLREKVRQSSSLSGPHNLPFQQRQIDPQRINGMGKYADQVIVSTDRQIIDGYIVVLFNQDFAYIGSDSKGKICSGSSSELEYYSSLRSLLNDDPERSFAIHLTKATGVAVGERLNVYIATMQEARATKVQWWPE